MPAAANKALIAHIYGEMARGDILSLLSHLTDDIEWTHQIDPQLAKFGGTHKGIPAVAKNFQDINAVMPPAAIVGLEMTAEDERVTVLCKITRTRENRTVSTRSSHHFTFRDGKIATFLEILDTAEVLEQIQDSALEGASI